MSQYLLNSFEMLFKSMDIFRSLIDAIPDTIYYKDIDGICHICNNSAAKQFGKSKEELQGHKLECNVMCPMYDDCQEAEKHVMTTKTCLSYDGTVIHAAKGDIVMTISKIPVLDQNNNIQGILTYSRDITEYVIQQRQLCRLQNAVKYTSSAIIITDKNGIIEYVNPAFEQLTGYSEKEAIGQKPNILKSGRHDKTFYENMWHTIMFGKIWRGIIINKKKDGTLYWEQSTISPVLDMSGNIRNFLAIKHDITEQRQLEQKYHGLLNDFMALLETTPNFIYIKDIDHRYTACSQSFAQRAGYNDWRELIGKTVWDIFPNEYAERFYEQDKIVMETGRELIDIESEYLKRDGEKGWVHSNKRPIKDKDGNVTGMIGVSTDITKLKQTEFDLIKAKRLADEASKAKSAFLANMSHEIRTPLNAVLGYTYLARRYANNKELLDYLNKITISSNFLIETINDILDLSKIEAGKLQLEIFPFQLTDITTKLQTIIEPVSAKKGIRFEIHLSGEIPQYLKGDHVRLSQVLVNLCNNAVKFTEQGSVDVFISAERITDKQATIYFEVKDTGIGMSEEQLLRIFEPFEQADASTTRRFGGTGLGLMISRRLIEMMKGRIGVKSIYGKGTSFYFTLNIDIPNHNEIQGQLTSANLLNDIENSLSGITALLVEDQQFNQEVAKSILEMQNMNVIIAENGEQAIARLQANADIDVILMDIQMPVMDGYEATRQIRKMNDKNINSLPIIAMTANHFKDDIDKCMAAGMNDFASKPIEPEMFFSTIKKWLKKNSNQNSTISHEGMTTEQVEAENFELFMGVKLYNIKVQDAMKRLGNNEQLYLRLLNLFYNTYGIDFQQKVNDSIQEQAKDSNSIVRFFHSLKSSAGTLGADRLMEHAKKLEEIAKQGAFNPFDASFAALEKELNIVMQSLHVLCEQKDANPS